MTDEGKIQTDTKKGLGLEKTINVIGNTLTQNWMVPDKSHKEKRHRKGVGERQK